MTGLVEAVRSGDLYQVEKLLSEGADPNGTDPQGFFPLLVAIDLESVEMVAELLKHGADPNKVGFFPLYAAIELESVEMVTELLRYGADPNRVGFNGIFPLMQAANDDQVDVVSELLKYGANPQMKFIDQANPNSPYTGKTALEMYKMSRPLQSDRNPDILFLLGDNRVKKSMKISHKTFKGMKLVATATNGGFKIQYHKSGDYCKHVVAKGELETHLKKKHINTPCPKCEK